MAPGWVVGLEIVGPARSDPVIGVFGRPECGQTPSWRGFQYRQGYPVWVTNWKPELEEKRAQ